MNLNLPTAAIFCALVNLALGIGMWLLWNRERLRYLLFWSAGFFAFGTGALLLTSQKLIPDFFAISIGNLCTTLSTFLFHIGICLFFDRRRLWQTWMLLVLAVETVLILYFSQIDYSTSARVYVYSAAQALLVSATLLVLMEVRRERGAGVNPEVLVITVLSLLFHSARIIFTPFFPMPKIFMDSGNVQTLLAFGMIVIHTSYALAFSNMHASALNASLNAALRDAKNNERQKVEVLGYVSHDLRAPLATIDGYSAVLLAQASEHQKKLIQTIQRSVKYQLSLIDELLEYAKAELQPLTIHPDATDLPLLLDNVHEYATALCLQQNNAFRYHAPDRVPPLATLDGRRLQQVLLNLLANAAKFTRDGSVTLDVKAKANGDVCQLHFAVIDTGMGMDLDQGTDIFAAFQQLQATSGSTGLGLFIAQRILVAMNSSLSVASTPGKGSRFSFVLAVRAIPASEADWTVSRPSRVALREQTLQSVLAGQTELDDRALSELADLALHGRLSDIGDWLERHAKGIPDTVFATEVKNLLECFDFPGIRSLAMCTLERRQFSH